VFLTGCALGAAVAALALVVIAARNEPTTGRCASKLTRAERTFVKRPAPAGVPAAGRDGAPASGGGAASAEDRPQPVDGGGHPVKGVPEMAFKFGRDREPMVLHQPIRLPAGMNPAPDLVSAPFGDVVSEDGRPLPGGQIRGYLTPSGEVTTVTICVNPGLATMFEPGSYTGTAVVGRGERTMALPLRVTVQDTAWWWVAAAAAIGVVAGLAVKVAADVQSSDHSNTVWKNVWHVRTLFAAGAGVVAGVYSFLTIYYDDPTFKADFGGVWRVTVEAFAGTLAAKALTDLTGKSKTRKDEEKAEETDKEKDEERNTKDEEEKKRRKAAATATAAARFRGF
jgi:hypothetical protein